MLALTKIFLGFTIVCSNKSYFIKLFDASLQCEFILTFFNQTIVRPKKTFVKTFLLPRIDFEYSCVMERTSCMSSKSDCFKENLTCILVKACLKLTLVGPYFLHSYIIERPSSIRNKYGTQWQHQIFSPQIQFYYLGFNHGDVTI